VPPIIPLIKIGAYAFVIIASGKLIRSPKIKPLAQPGKDKLLAAITNPIPNRLIKAPVIAAVLSGNESGIIKAVSIKPKTPPQIAPSRIPDIFLSHYKIIRLFEDLLDLIKRQFNIKLHTVLFSTNPHQNMFGF
jgi:hypothetical protein